MVSVDALRTTVATAVGIIATVLFSGYLPVPAALCVGTLAFVGLRRAFHAVYDGPHGLIAMFVVIGGAALVDRFPPEATVPEAISLFVVAAVMLAGYETLLRVGVAADAGGFEEAGISRVWKGPGALVALLVGVEDRLGTRGFEASLGSMATLVFVGIHTGLVWVEANVALLGPAALVAVAALGGTGLAATPRSHFDDSLRGSVLLSVGRPYFWATDTIETVREANQGQADARSTGSKSTGAGSSRSAGSDRASSRDAGSSSRAAGSPSGDAGTPSPDSGANPLGRISESISSAGARIGGALSRSATALPDGGSIRSSDRFGRIKRGVGSVGARIRGGTSAAGRRAGNAVASLGSALGSSNSGSGDGTASTGTATAGTNAADPSTTPNPTGTTASVETACQNCGQERPDVAPRVLVTNPPRSVADNEVRLCQACQSARSSSAPIDGCRTGLPVDRSRVIAAAGQQCQCCGHDAGRVDGALEPHAVVPMDGEGHPHEHNVVALCPTCHESAHGG